MRCRVGAALLAAFYVGTPVSAVRQNPMEEVESLLAMREDMHPDNWPPKPARDEVELIDSVAGKCSFTNHRQLESAVVVYLITRQKDVKWLVEKAAARAYKFFLQQWPYPVVVFVPSDRLREYDPGSYGSSPTAEELRNQLQRSGLPDNFALTVEEFDLEYPKSLPADWRSRQSPCARLFKDSYKHMNQFFTKVMYEHPAMSKYKYYMRLDADLLFTQKVALDPFCMIRETGRKFMFQTREYDSLLNCSQGMFEWFEDYAKSHKLTAKDTSLWRSDRPALTYTGYIGVGDLDFFRRKDVSKLANAFNADGRVYLNRWADQAYYVLLLALMEPHSAVGDVGISWPAETWCHKSKCRTTHSSTVDQLSQEAKDA